jgi:osmoprotectant transport system permease protein
VGSSSNTTDSRAAASDPGAAAERRRTDRALTVTGAVIGLATTFVGPFLVFKPNRIVQGVGATALEAFGGAAWAIALVWVAVGALSLRSPGRYGGLLRATLAVGAFGAGLAASGHAAAGYAAEAGSIARTSLGTSFYVSLLGLFLVLYQAMEVTPGRFGRAIAFVAPFAAVAALVAAGAIDELAFAREWVFVRDAFAREFRRHLAYSLGGTAGAVAIGVPLGVLAARRRRAEAVIMGALNLGQVLPALAFVGVMMPVLGALGNAVPPLKALGVSGIGWAPVLVVLLVYALFPVTRNTAVAIKQLDPAVLDAARGMGMSRRRQLFEVELPLAFPVVLAGIRIALVQTTAGAIVAAFVGGGGLGAIMFVGLEQTSIDLVLLGVGPIVALALVFVAALRGIERLSPAVEVPAA